MIPGVRIENRPSKYDACASDWNIPFHYDAVLFLSTGYVVACGQRQTSFCLMQWLLIVQWPSCLAQCPVSAWSIRFNLPIILAPSCTIIRSRPSPHSPPCSTSISGPYHEICLNTQISSYCKIIKSHAYYHIENNQEAARPESHRKDSRQAQNKARQSNQYFWKLFALPTHPPAKQEDRQHLCHMQKKILLVGEGK